MSVADHQYLIIGGTPKAGTTSLYKWLSDHPDVCPSSLKETRFFLDWDYPLSSSAQYNGKNLEQYAVFLNNATIINVCLEWMLRLITSIQKPH